MVRLSKKLIWRLTTMAKTYKARVLIFLQERSGQEFESYQIASAIGTGQNTINGYLLDYEVLCAAELMGTTIIGVIISQ
jgi:hypothetical protein